MSDAVAEAVSSVVVALIGSAATIGVAWLGARSGKGPFRKVEDAAVWKQRYELAEARREADQDRCEDRVRELEEERDQAKRSLEEERERRVFAERDADAADRRLSAAYAELRSTGRLVDRRKVPRDEETKPDA